MSEPSGKTIGRYIVQSLLGEGAMGSVYKAFDPVIRRIVAIKTIKLEQSRSEADQREFMQRFFQEAQISGILNHPNIVAVYDIGEQDGMPYIAMEYVEGRNLNQIIHSSPRPDTTELSRILMQVACALEFAHGKGIVHRDLKPGNIMVTPKGVAKIMDFGIAKMSDSHLTQTGVFLGTPSFASPEQIKEGHVDHRSDIFSLGILAHETLTGHTPFPGQSISAILYKIANEPPSPPPNLTQLPIDPAKWRLVFDRVFQKDANRRYQHAAEFGQDLIGCLRVSDTERARLGTFMGSMDAGVRDAFGIQKDIQRSEFEMSQAPQPPAQRTIHRPAGKSNVMAGVVVIALLLLVVGLGGAMQMGLLGEDLRLSSLLPLHKLLPAKEIEKTIILNSLPGEAAISLNGQPPQNKTPYTFKLAGPVGSETSIRLEKEGFKPLEHRLVLRPDMETELRLVLDVMPVVRLISSEPPGAEVFVNDKRLGVSPVHGEFTPQNMALIRLALEGYHPAEISYVEGSSKEEVLAVPLKKILPPGQVEVSSEMEDLVVSLDGRVVGTSFSVPAGKYKLALSSKRYFFQESRSLQVESGRRQSLGTPPLVSISKIDVIGGYARVRLDGFFIKNDKGGVEYTPIANLRLAAGSHVFKFEDDNGKIIGQVTREVKNGDQIIISAN